jgi:hypothetical protein
MIYRNQLDGSIYYYGLGVSPSVRIDYDGFMGGYQDGNRFAILQSGLITLSYSRTTHLFLRGTEWPGFVKEFYNLFNYAKTVHHPKL